MILVLAAVAFVFGSCTSSNVCMENMDVEFKVQLMEMNFDQIKDQYISGKHQSTVKVYGVGMDSMLYNQVSVTQLALPLNPNDSMTEFIIEQMGKDSVYVADTLTVLHDNELEFVSLECGCAVLNHVKEVKHTVNALDSVILKESDVLRNGGVNIQLYVKMGSIN